MELAGFGQCVTQLLIPHSMGIACTAYVEYKQASDQSPPPSPCLCVAICPLKNRPLWYTLGWPALGPYTGHCGAAAQALPDGSGETPVEIRIYS